MVPPETKASLNIIDESNMKFVLGAGRPLAGGRGGRGTDANGFAVLSGAGTDSGAGPVAAWAPPLRSEGGSSLACVGNSRRRLIGIGRAWHDTPPSDRIGAPPLRATPARVGPRGW